MEENGNQAETERASSMSPAHGTQEPPVDISSQEEVEGRKDSNVKNNQINWDALIQEEDATDVQKKQTEEAVIENNLNSQEQQENMAAAGDKQEKLAVNEWQVVRQSKRGKDQEQRSNGKEGNSAERITQDKVEGNMSITKNSFAVLDSSKLIDIAGNMGIDRGVLSFDNIDMLRDLEIARAALNNPVIPMNMESSENLEENSPFSENNIGGWQTDESESEVCPIASSIKKKRKGKYNKKTNNAQQSRGKENQPVDGVSTSTRDKSMVSPRFNLRDRKTIKKVYK
jgi:hypothetical protein